MDAPSQIIVAAVREDEVEEIQVTVDGTDLPADDPSQWTVDWGDESRTITVSVAVFWKGEELASVFNTNIYYIAD